MIELAADLCSSCSARGRHAKQCVGCNTPLFVVKLLLRHLTEPLGPLRRPTVSFEAVARRWVRDERSVTSVCCLSPRLSVQPTHIVSLLLSMHRRRLLLLHPPFQRCLPLEQRTQLLLGLRFLRLQRPLLC